eukprot:5671614-Amphidinium_carterae.1
MEEANLKRPLQRRRQPQVHQVAEITRIQMHTMVLNLKLYGLKSCSGDFQVLATWKSQFLHRWEQVLPHERVNKFFAFTTAPLCKWWCTSTPILES